MNNKNENSFASEQDLQKLITALSDFTGFNWEMNVGPEEVEVRCSGEFVYRGTPRSVERKLIDLAKIMSEIKEGR